MWKCKYCGKSSGFFSRSHKACKQKFREGKQLYASAINKALGQDFNAEDLKSELAFLEKEHYLDSDTRANVTSRVLSEAVDQYLDDGILSEEEEAAFLNVKTELGLPQEITDKQGALSRLIMSAVLRELTEGKVPEPRVNVTGDMPFIFQKSEKLIWVFPDVEFYEQKTRTEYRGGSQGVSIKIAKGVYYRTGTFKGKPVKISEMKYISTGILALTSKHVYFSSPLKKFRIRMDRIVSVDTYEDGIGLQKDGVTAKPQVFKNLDGWFTRNVIANVNQL